ncbi:hypothetical protein HDU86_001238 [Geranomyces michiganensis]|nr:hypothetical protein HDU86_001238 [Geranomyces michiganensis]
MSLFYQLVFIILISEMLLFGLLIAPLPLGIRRSMLKWMSTSPLLTQSKSYFRIMFLYVSIMFVDSLNKVFNTNPAHHHHHEGDAFHRANVFREQRNLYLTGAVLFLSLLLNRFFAMIAELMSNETKSETLKKQAAKQSTDYLRLLDKEHEHAAQLDALNKKIDELDAKARQVDIVTRQAKQVNDEYMRLTDRFVELERKYDAARSGGGGAGDDARKSR